MDDELDAQIADGLFEKVEIGLRHHCRGRRGRRACFCCVFDLGFKFAECSFDVSVHQRVVGARFW